ncbi:hypothetical protein R2G56_21065 [Nitratireductor aquimarinus]|uniref:Uncharacterized protein n=1 Tax=Nitratireductor aquimarinus TaxID=889300 RepID=A0ABU4ARJ6_9HYPH|nr:hypothetical protein [Nitratireductor aquimarinus]MDV6228786.1 hypothetical protein [Nitratireductor aquimarinus]
MSAEIAVEAAVPAVDGPIGSEATTASSIIEIVLSKPELPIAGVATLAAVIAIILTCYQIREANKARALDWLFKYLDDVKNYARDFRREMSEYWEEVEEGNVNAEVPLVFTELVNFMEALCLAHNKKLIPRTHRDFVKQGLCQLICFAEDSPLSNKFESSIKNSSMDGIKRFRLHHYEDIQNTRAELKAAEQL